MGTRVLELALGALVLVLLFLGLYPLSFSPPNLVGWIDPGPGLRFHPNGMVYSEASLALDLESEASGNGTAFTLHILVSPAREPSSDLGIFLCLYDQQEHDLLLVTQWERDLVVHARSSAAERGYWELGVPETLRRGETHLITLSSEPLLGTILYVDGVEGQRTRHSIVGTGEHFDAGLLLGCQSDGKGAFDGSILAVGLLARAQDPADVRELSMTLGASGGLALLGTEGLAALYLFDVPEGEAVLDSSPGRPDVALRIPKDFRPLRLNFLKPPGRRHLSQAWFLRDCLRNVVAFVPLGFLVFLLSVRGGVTRWAALMVGGGLSLFIELLQVFLPMRSSSLTDLVANVAGTGLGALTALAWLTLRRRRAAPSAPGSWR